MVFGKVGAMPEHDEEFETFTNEYPANRRQRGFLVTQAFLSGVRKVGFETLMAALRQHKRSVEWQEKPSMIPSEKKWLEEERWIQELPERCGGPGLSKVTDAAIRAIREAGE